MLVRQQSCVPWGPALALLALVVVALPGCSRNSGAGSLSTEPKALARQVADAMGGQRAFDRTDFLMFNFTVWQDGKRQVRRSHNWDRQTGHYRLETIEGQTPVIVLFNLNDRTGRAWRGLKPVEEPDLTPLIEKAINWHISDSFWVTAPFNTRKPGTHLAYPGEWMVDGRSLPTLELTLDDEATLLPRDHYWFHIDPQTRQPAALSIAPRGQNTPATTYRWTGWQKIGALTLATRFENLALDRQIVIEKLVIPSEGVERWVFTEPFAGSAKPIRSAR